MDILLIFGMSLAILVIAAVVANKLFGGKDDYYDV